MGVNGFTARAFVVLASLSLAAGACSSKTSSSPAARPAATTGAAAATRTPAGASALPSSPLERVARLKELYRPHPDRRVLGALRDVVHIVGGQIAVEPVAAFDGTSWTVKAGDQELARLPEIPSFEDALSACVALAHKLEKSRPWKLDGAAPTPTPTLPFDDEAFAALAAAQTSWAKAPTRAALHDAARALVAIDAASLDSMGVGDDLHARVLATVAIDKAFGGSTANLEAMLAWNLSYTRSARALGASLPATDPLHAFFARDDVSLGRAAAAPGAARWTKYLHLRALTALGDRAGATKWERTAFPDGSLILPILTVRNADTELAVRKGVATILPPAVLLATGRAAGAKDALEWGKALRHDPADDAATAGAIRDALHADRGSTLVRFDQDIDARADADPGLGVGGRRVRRHAGELQGGRGEGARRPLCGRRDPRTGARAAVATVLAQGLRARVGRRDAVDAARRVDTPARFVDGYLVLEVWKGEPAAVQWLQPLVKPAELELLGEIGFLESVEEIVWTVSADTKNPSSHDNLWLLRAASTRRVKALAKKLAEAKAHYEADAGAGTYWNEMGKYVVGLTDDKTMAALAHDAHTICEASFYMGARAEGEGRYADANDLYRSAVEAAALNVGECKWATSTLLRWRNSDLPLARMGESAYPVVEERR